MRDDPRRYAREHAHYVEDLAFWRDEARRASGPVLDLGCAAGRIAVPLARDGVDVWALDADADMLAETAAAARAAGAGDRLTTVHADMRGFAVDARFGLVIAAMNTLQTLLTPEDQLACLRAVRGHLRPGGRLTFDVTLPDLGEMTDRLGVVRHTGEHRDEASGALLLHSAWIDSVEPISQTVCFTIQIDEIGPDGSMTRYLRRHEVHVYVPSELRHLLARAGLAVEDVFGDFEGAPVSPGSETQVYRCRVA